MNVEFHEEDLTVPARPKVQKVSLFTRLMYKLKIADNEASAQKVMLIAALCCFGIAFVLFLNFAGVF